tara:strand:- start:413 stop:1498 length:1086 start_codon:yes stop_codon:yes gene_type:complete
LGIPISKPYLNEQCRSNFIDAYDSSWISSIGSYIKEFEDDFSNYVDTEYCLTTSNGTTALELALASLDLDYKSEVIIPDLTFAAVVNAVISKGLSPVLADVSIKDWNISLESIKKRISSNTKAVILVHSYGVPVKDIIKIKDFCKLKRIWLIEDCAEAHGAKFQDKMVGSFGDISTFSFYGNKIITSGEGGAVLTSNQNLYKKMKMLRDHGMSEEIRYFHNLSGFNYRITNPQAALLKEQLRSINQFIEKRSLIKEKYNEYLLGLKFKLQDVPLCSNSVNWLYTVLCPKHLNRNALQDFLKKNGIDTRPIFKPISSFPYTNNYENPNSKKLSLRGISLPTFFELEENQIKFICSKIKEFSL